jgi:phenylpropionate dioxygenase-like ring-hydroxylating dioxygenase large terminal subunit
MSKYRADPEAVRALFDGDRVHRDVYLSEEVFALEQERLFARVWIFLGHDSQVPKAGDFISATLIGRPLLMVRQADGAVRVLANRCAHKGAVVTAEAQGNTGKAFVCPYHGWSYQLDGGLDAIPMRRDYDQSRIKECEAAKGLHQVASVTYRGFVFVQLDESGPSFQDYFGSTLTFLDQMADRSPVGELEMASPPLRNRLQCNWKAYIENINDVVHVPVAHEASARSAAELWGRQPEGTPKTTAIEQLLPFDQIKFDPRDHMGCRVYPNGHSLLGTKTSIHAAYSGISGYTESLEAAYGAEKSQKILGFAPQNAVLYPSIAFKTSIQVMRVLRPVAAEETVLEAWAFRLKGASDAFADRSMSYNRTVFSPMSVLAQDDGHMFETIQRGLRAPGNEWISLHRGYDPAETDSKDYEAGGMNEVLMRNQFRAWIDFLTKEGPRQEIGG